MVTHHAKRKNALSSVLMDVFSFLIKHNDSNWNTLNVSVQYNDTGKIGLKKAPKGAYFPLSYEINISLFSKLSKNNNYYDED